MIRKWRDKHGEAVVKSRRKTMSSWGVPKSSKIKLKFGDLENIPLGGRDLDAIAVHSIFRAFGESE